MTTNDFTLRPATEQDIPAVVGVINAASVAEGGEADTTIGEIHNQWRDPHFNPVTDTWVAVDPDGTIVGYETAEDFDHPEHVTIDGYVAPQATNRGIGRAMVRAAEARVREAFMGASVEVHSTVGGRNQPAHILFESQGYHFIRQFLRMEIEFAERPAAVQWPEGICVRSFVVGQDEAATHVAITESFRDHWGSAALPFDEWVQTRVGNEGFDPSLWLLALEGDTVVGVALSRKRADIAWLNTLGVRQPWRSRGIGMALLQHVFATFYERGERRMGLGVDSQSLTGATRLYERAGMHVAERYDTFAKTIIR